MATTVMKGRATQKYDTEANWTSKNPVLLPGEMAISSDKNGQFKTGNGTSTWSQLSYNQVPWTSVTGRPSTMKNPNSLVLKLNGGTTEGTDMFTYDGSASKTPNITPASIGAATASHGTHVVYSTIAPKAAGTASAGFDSNVSRGDHVHPLQTSVSGNAGSATKLATARKIGNASFNGTTDITLSAIGAAAISHQHTIDNIAGLQTKLNSYDSDINILKNGIELDGGTASTATASYDNEIDGGGA